MVDKEKTELKPCPCCGGGADVHTDDSIGISITYFVYCIKCDMATNSMTHRVDVVKIWNARHSITAHEQSLLLKLEGMYQTVERLKQRNKDLVTENKLLRLSLNDHQQAIDTVKASHSDMAELYRKERLKVQLLENDILRFNDLCVKKARVLGEEVNRVKLRNSELKELLYAADAIIGEERLASAKITWISTAVVELKQAQEDTDKKAEEEADNG